MQALLSPPETPYDCSNAERSTTKGNVLLEHFWKLFAVVLLAGLLFESHEVLSQWDADRAMKLNLANRKELTDSNLRDSDLLNHFASGLKKQSSPAHVVFKGQKPPVSGYLQEIGDKFVVLSTLYETESRVEDVLIPWDNIQFIRVHKSEAKGK